MSELRKRVRTYNWGTTASNLEGGEERRGEERRRRGEERRGEERERRGEERRGEERGGRRERQGRGRREKGKVGTKQQLQHKIHHLHGAPHLHLPGSVL